jgi:hypothetical protein
MHQYEDAERMATEALALYPNQPREHDYTLHVRIVVASQSE